MERPNKEDYDFNDVFEGVRFASNMIKYADYLEAKQLTIPFVAQRSELLLFADYSESDKVSQTTDECVDNYLDQKQ